MTASACRSPRLKRYGKFPYIIGILAATTEIPALMPIGRLNGKAPVILQVESISVSPAFDTMTLNAFLIDNQRGALLQALLSRLNRLDGSQLKDGL